jgi:hypothetical protein
VSQAGNFHGARGPTAQKARGTGLPGRRGSVSPASPVTFPRFARKRKEERGGGSDEVGVGVGYVSRLPGARGGLEPVTPVTPPAEGHPAPEPSSLVSVRVKALLATDAAVALAERNGSTFPALGEGIGMFGVVCTPSPVHRGASPPTPRTRGGGGSLPVAVAAEPRLPSRDLSPFSWEVLKCRRGTLRSPTLCVMSSRSVPLRPRHDGIVIHQFLERSVRRSVSIASRARARSCQPDCTSSCGDGLCESLSRVLICGGHTPAGGPHE